MAITCYNLQTNMIIIYCYIPKYKLFIYIIIHLFTSKLTSRGIFASCFGEVGWSGRGGNNVQVPVAHPVNAFSRHAHRWYSIDHVRLQGPWYFGSNLQPILDATLSTFLSNLRHALDAALSTLLSKHFFPAVFHDACIMESKHKNIQNFISSFTDTVGDNP